MVELDSDKNKQMKELTWKTTLFWTNKDSSIWSDSRIKKKQKTKKLSMIFCIISKGSSECYNLAETFKDSDSQPKTKILKICLCAQFNNWRSDHKFKNVHVHVQFRERKFQKTKKTKKIQTNRQKHLNLRNMILCKIQIKGKWMVSFDKVG